MYLWAVENAVSSFKRTRSPVSLSARPDRFISLHRRVIRASIFFFTSCAFSMCIDASAESPTLTWKKLTNDLEVATATVQSGALFSSQLTLVRTALKDFRVGVLRAAEFGDKRTDAKSICKEAKAVACVNANFFDEDGKALGLVVSRGVTYQKIHAGGKLLNGIFQAGRENLEILNRSAFVPGAALEAVQAGPILIQNGKIVDAARDTQSYSLRAGVCIDSSKNLILFSLSSALRGVSIAELQDELLDPAVGCKDALNFDGGGSAQLFVNTELVGANEAPIHLLGGDVVPAFLALFRKESV